MSHRAAGREESSSMPAARDEAMGDGLALASPGAPSPGAPSGAPASIRERILARVREAAASHEASAHPGALALPSSGVAPIELFAARLESAGGEVVRFATAADALAWLGTWSRAFDSAAISARVPAALRPDLRAAPPDEAALAISVARAGAAETGTLLMDSREGRRLQLLAPVHLVWVGAGTVHPTLEEALRTVRDDRGAAVGLHSGPSKSADIGGVLVRGVHGPGRLIAAVVPDEMVAGAWGEGGGAG